jgi:3-methylcrotonyl-CoA carboxylase alpha subunit
VKTNAGFLARAASDPDFLRGDIDTGFIERHAARVIPPTEPDEIVRAAAAAALLPGENADPWRALAGFRSASAFETRVAVEIGGKTHLVQPAADGVVRTIAGDNVLFLNGDAWPFSEPRPMAAGEAGAGDGAVLAPMPGAVILLEIAPGQPLKRGQRLLVLEAMKMEYILVAPFDGTVTDLTVSVGSQVQEGALLARIEREG